jgi:hypothetical protein
MKWPWPNLGQQLASSLVMLRKVMKDLRQDRQSPGRNMNSGPFELESRVLPTQHRRQEIV